MLRRHNEKDQDIFLETNTDYYTIDVLGNLFHVEKTTPPKVNQIIAYYKGDELFVDIKNKSVRLANIINFVFKNANPDFFWEIMEWDIIYIDNNKTNLYPFNLSWNNTNIKDDEEGFRLIPGFTRYKINRDGVIKRIDNNRIISTHDHKAKRVKIPYKGCSVFIDYGREFITQKIHRLVAYSYLPMPNNYFDLDVSHLDCNPQNNSIDNLMWQSRRDNNLQTAKQCLTSYQQPMLVYDIDNDKITEYFSIREMERKRNLTKGLGEIRVLSRGTVRYSDGCAYMLKEHFEGKWPEVEFDGRRPTINYPLIMVNKESKEETVFHSLRELARYTNLSKSCWKFRLRRPPYKWEDDKTCVYKKMN